MYVRMKRFDNETNGIEIAAEDNANEKLWILWRHAHVIITVFH